ncbi:MAG TPA: undecaprenyl-diphosphate phosphatase [Alphaproteobacteria bacterium]|nr:undecaprenyl-diphosphate phosphatase [Alphaproteobacteria bacterium]
MPLLSILILSIVQAITEFLPISSSGHLVVLHEFLTPGGGDAWGAELVMDLAVHVGTLLAVIVYYHKDVWAMITGVLRWLARSKQQDAESCRLAFYLIIASVPVMVLGVLLTLWEPEWLRSVQVVAWTVFLYGILLWWVDAKFPADKQIADLNWRGAMLIGFAQMMALVPGTSRSGITMTAARYQGLSRTEAARFSFLLSIIAMTAAGGMGALKLIESGNTALAGDALIATGVTFVSALCVMAFLMKFLQTHTFKAFAIYRIALGIGLLTAVYVYGWS